MSDSYFYVYNIIVRLYWMIITIGLGKLKYC